MKVTSNSMMFKLDRRITQERKISKVMEKSNLLDKGPRKEIGREKEL